MKIEHVAMWCKDIEVMKDFYETYFLAESNELYVNEDKGFSSYFLRFAGSDTRFELMHRDDITEASESQLLGLAHLAFQVSSQHAVDELTQLLVNGGYRHVGGPRTTGDGYYESTIQDPEGNTIEITC